MSDYGMFPVDAEAAEVRLCGGFRMTAHRDDSACTGAVVRKPPVKERAGDEVPTVTRAPWRFDRAAGGVWKSAGRGDEVVVRTGLANRL